MKKAIPMVNELHEKAMSCIMQHFSVF